MNRRPSTPCRRPVPGSLPWQQGAAVEDANIVEPEKTAFVKIVAGAIFAVSPPSEVPCQLGKNPPQELEIAIPAQCLFRPVEKDRGPGVHRRIDIAEVPLIGRDLTAGVLISPDKQEVELLLGEIYVDGRQRDRVEGEVPSGKPLDIPTCPASRSHAR